MTDRMVQPKEGISSMESVRDGDAREVKEGIQSQHLCSDAVLRTMAGTCDREAMLEERAGQLSRIGEHPHQYTHSVALRYCEEVIKAARDSGLSDAKPFAFVQPVQQGAMAYVQGPDWLWELTPLVSFGQLIPPQALRAVTWVRAQSLSIKGMWVAAPASTASSVPAPESVLITTIADMLLTSPSKAWAGTKKGAHLAMSGAKLAGIAGLVVALVPVIGVARLLGKDPVLVVQVIPALDGGESCPAVLVELARWM